ncbi:MAG: hypothetical protein GXO82_07395 [Chlorobi bacterium]|nr:hypothetical protein [Chlorobiota bacterium]
MNQYPREAAEKSEEERFRIGARRRVIIIVIEIVLIAVAVYFRGYLEIVRPAVEVSDLRTEVNIKAGLRRNLSLVLQEYGFDPAWISLGCVYGPEGDTVRVLWSIRTPPGVALFSLAHDVDEAVQEFGAFATGVENPRTHEMTIHIRRGIRLVHSMHFTYDQGIRRRAGVVSVLLDGLADASRSDIERYMEDLEDIACLIKPAPDQADLARELSVGGKEIILHFHFAERRKGGTSVFAEDMSPGVLRNRTERILNDFRGAVGFYITTESSIPRASKNLRAMLRARGLRPLPTEILMYVDRSDDPDIMTARMNEIAEAAVQNGSAIAVVELHDDALDFIDANIERLRKRGFRFQAIHKILEQQ